MNHLFRELAPISEAGWEEITAEADRSLRSFLTARRLVDVVEAGGWTVSALSNGRVSTLADSPVPGVRGAQRQVLPFVELRTDLQMSRAELEAVDRGAPDADFDAVKDAARAAALAEDLCVFSGYDAAGITGIVQATPHDPIAIPDDYGAYPTAVARAVALLRNAGVDGPYGLALGPRCYTGVIETTEHGGYPLLEHLRMIVGGPVVWAPAVDGAVVLSQRGGDFELSLGQDLAIGYTSHDASDVSLYLEESITFRALSPEAAVRLAYL